MTWGEHIFRAPRKGSSYPPKKVQQTIITVASDPLFEGDRKPSKAKTEDVK